LDEVSLFNGLLGLLVAVVVIEGVGPRHAAPGDLGEEGVDDDAVELADRLVGRGHQRLEAIVLTFRQQRLAPILGSLRLSQAPETFVKLSAFAL